MDSLAGWDKLALVGDSSHPSAGTVPPLAPMLRTELTRDQAGLDLGLLMRWLTAGPWHGPSSTPDQMQPRIRSPAL